MNKKKIITIIILLLVLLLAFLLFWFFYLSPRLTFQKQEEEFRKAGERYFEINANLLPKEEGRYAGVSLAVLTEQKYLDRQYVPNSDKLCDVDTSFYRVIYRDGELVPHYYLKCGSYESDVDHEGPEITLNGGDTVQLNLGEAYQEQGVKSVVDDTDGPMKAEDVSIKGTVDSNTIGAYTITYTIYDSFFNKTEKERTVQVVETLNHIMDQAGITTYQGLVENNYVSFQHMLFRIVRKNEDGTIVLVSDDPIANVDYSSSDGRFEDSSLDHYLNDYFASFFEKKYADLLVDQAWCDDVITMDNVMTTDCSRTSSKRKVGILSLQDYNASLLNGQSYLDMRNLFWMANFDENGNPWTLSTIFAYPDRVEAMNGSLLVNVRPAIVLKKDIAVLDGDGSQLDPYILVSEKSAHRSSPLNERHTGEYLNYSGYLWRIMDTEDDLTEAIMVRSLSDGANEISISYQNTGEKVYNPKEEGNIGYQINYNMTNYIDTSYLVRHEIEVPIYQNAVTYLGNHSTETYEVLLSAPSTFDLFSAKGNIGPNGGYWLMDSSQATNNRTLVFPVGNTPLGAVVDDYTSAGVKVKVKFNKKVYIRGGSGTSNDPYTLAQ